MRITSLFVAALLTCTTGVKAADPPLAEYFRSETAKLSAKPLLEIDSAETWKARRPELQTKLKSMLGLVPEPPRGDLKVEVRGTIERPDFVIEKIVYQSMPGLYVTANLYRPKTIEKPLPAILYVCGHSRVEKEGVIYGSKAHYQHHAAWFAANGYVCLIVDTLELGEVPGEHHGTYSKNRWWWSSRGYTPAGVEAWNGVRAIDYLVSRPEVDAKKIGVTGRSGGGATSWWIGAIDDRVAAVCPVAGITDLKNHVVDGVVEGHCDCMFFTNTERWDYTMLAALVAPKPLLVENTDKDPIFPLDGVSRIYAQAEKVYGWYDAKDRLSLIVGKGGHIDSEELRHPAFAFFEKYLKGKADVRIVEPDRKTPIEELRALRKGETFPDSKNATVDEGFVAAATPPEIPKNANKETFEAMKTDLLKRIQSETFHGWPTESEIPPLDVRETVDLLREGIRLRSYEFTSQEGVRLAIYRFTPEAGADPKLGVNVWILDQTNWTDDWAWLVDSRKAKSFTRPARDGDTGRFEPKRSDLSNLKGELVLMTPRGVGPTAWEASKETHIRRRFALLGQTLSGMRIWDIRRGIASLQSLSDTKGKTFRMLAGGDSATLALWAAIFEPSVASITLESVPRQIRLGPELLNLERILDTPQAISLMFPRGVTISRGDETPGRWDWASVLARSIAQEPFPADQYLHFIGETSR